MKLKNDIVNLIVRVEHHLCPQYCGVVDRRRVIAFLLLTISELIIIPYHIMLFLLVKEPYGLSLCGLHTFVFCILQFLVWKRNIAFVKGISSLYFLMFAKLALDSVFCINFGFANDNLSVICNLFVVFILAITALSQTLYHHHGGYDTDVADIPVQHSACASSVQYEDDFSGFHDAGLCGSI